MRPSFPRLAFLCGTVGLAALLSLPAHVGAQPTYPPATTPVEQLAEIGELLATLDMRKNLGDLADACNRQSSALDEDLRRLCARQQEREAVWRAKHARLCKELKIQDGRYGCK